MAFLKKIFLIMTISLFSLSSFAQSDVAGKWTFGKQNTIVEIKQNNGVYKGKLIASDNPKAKKGTVIVKNLKKINGKWKGKIFAPRRNDWYNAEFTPKGKTMDVKIKAGFISKTIKWTKK